MSDEVLIRVDGLGKKFCRDLKTSLWYGVNDAAADMVGAKGASDRLRKGEFWALEDVSFELRRGECLGLVGRNGAGKTTLLKMLNGLIKPDRGKIEIKGEIGALIALGAGFSPLLTGRENVYINGAVLGLSKKEIDEKYEEIVDFAEIGKFINAPVSSYSSGMQVRLGFAVATALRPDVLLLDEVLAVGDAAFRTKCFDRIGKLLTNAAVIFVSHSEAQIYRICDKALLLAGGRVVESGSPATVLDRYRSTDAYVRPGEHRITHERVTDVRLTARQEEIDWGGELTLDVAITLAKDIEVGAMLVHFWRSGDFVANGDVVWSGDDELSLPAGTTTLAVKLGPVHLQASTYSISLSIFDRSRKQTVLQWLHFADLQVVGPVGGGPPHLVPMTVASSGESKARKAEPLLVELYPASAAEGRRAEKP